MGDWKTMVVYTTETGGVMKVCWGGEPQYREMVETGLTPLEPFGNDPPPQKPVKMAALLDVRELHDFVIGGPRP